MPGQAIRHLDPSEGQDPHSPPVSAVQGFLQRVPKRFSRLRAAFSRLRGAFSPFRCPLHRETHEAQAPSTQEQLSLQQRLVRRSMCWQDGTHQ